MPTSTGSARLAGMSSTTSRAVAVTPCGNGLDVWASTIRRAVTEHAEQLRKGPGATLVVLSAHPDDETLGAGRLIAWWTRHAGPARAITLTAGEACLSAVGPSLVGMGARRLAEWAGAVGTLGAHPEPCWEFADGQLADSLDTVAGRLAQCLSREDVVLAPWRHDPHPDHGAAGLAADAACRSTGATLVEYPVWMTYWSRPRELEDTAYQLVRVATGPEDERTRAAALRHYRSQLEPLGTGLGPVVPAEMLAHHHSQLILRPVVAR